MTAEGLREPVAVSEGSRGGRDGGADVLPDHFLEEQDKRPGKHQAEEVDAQLEQ